MNTFELSRNWFDFAYENTDMVKPVHTALYFYCIDLGNRLAWIPKFGLPTDVTMTAIGIKNYKTYSKAFDALVKWGFITLHQRSKNQYTANVIGLVKNTKAVTKAHSKALSNHLPKQVQSIVDINKPINQETLKLVNSGDTPPEKIKVSDLLIQNALEWNQLIGIFSKISGIGNYDQTKEKLREFLEKEKAVEKEYESLSDLKSHMYARFEKWKGKKGPEPNGIDIKKKVDGIDYDERIGEKIH